MLEFLIGGLLGAGLAACVYKLAVLKQELLSFRDKHITKFYESADRIADWESITDRQLDKLAQYSALLGSRKMQLLAIQFMKESQREEANRVPAKVPEFRAHLTKDQSRQWNEMYFHWLAAVCSQGSIVAFGALTEFVNTLDPEDTAERAEKIISPRLAHVHES